MSDEIEPSRDLADDSPIGKFADRDYLRLDQYKGPENLNARIALHQNFSTNPIDWHQWVFDLLPNTPDLRILEVGCGPGDIWNHNLPAIPSGWQFYLSDFSPGMVRTARRNVDLKGLTSLVVDVQAIPFLAGYFNCVIANHMLYHVPRVPIAISEIARVLKPGGLLLASTNGFRHLKELRDYVTQFRQPESQAPDWTEMNANFGKQTGAGLLAGYFEQVHWVPHEDELLVTEVEPILAFLDSSSILGVSQDLRPALVERLNRELQATGVIRIQKESGVFVARK